MANDETPERPISTGYIGLNTGDELEHLLVPDDGPLDRPPTAEHEVLDLEETLEDVLLDVLHDMSNTIAAAYANISYLTLKCKYINGAQEGVIAEYADQAKASVDSIVEQIRESRIVISRNLQSRNSNMEKPTPGLLKSYVSRIHSIGQTTKEARQYVKTLQRIHYNHTYLDRYEEVQESFEEAVLGLTVTKELADLASNEDILRENQLEYVPRCTNINETVSTAMRLFSRKLKGSGIAIQAKPEMHLGQPREFYFIGDRLRMIQVMLNIFKNMYHALEETANPEINVGIVQDPDDEAYVRVTVLNNGPTVKDPKKLFKRRYSERGSSGLGIPICKRVVEKRFHGEIDVDNRTDRRGLVYILRLPQTELPTNH